MVKRRVSGEKHPVQLPQVQIQFQWVHELACPVGAAALICSLIRSFQGCPWIWKERQAKSIFSAETEPRQDLHGEQV